VSELKQTEFKMAQLQSPSLLPVHNVANSAHIPLDNMSSPPGVNNPTISTVKGYPWKTHGYQDFSKWMASEDDFFVFRRFESLNAGTILWMQYRISELEQRLEQIHEEIKDSDLTEGLKNSSFKWDETRRPERARIMCELSSLLLQYSKCTMNAWE
jgi:hypothetical protein